MKLPLAAILGLAFYLGETLLGWRRISSKEAGARSVDGGTMRVLWTTAALSIVAGLIVAYRPLGPRLPAGYPWRMASVAIFTLGMAFRWWAIIHLGRFFTVDISVAEGHRVVDNGPYRFVRHPSYTGLLMQYAGWALSLNSVVAVPVVFIPAFLSLRYRMRVEEAALTDALGENYAAYCRRTKRLVPVVY